MMAVESLRGFLENGQVHNSVNFPEAVMARQEDTHRLVIVNRNVPNMVGQVSTIVAQHGENIAQPAQPLSRRTRRHSGRRRG